ncbi:MAG: sigma-70 family RNA polymerase sigma factor [Thermoleophilaceae bacterium]|nr:sigma-70 family RNA polymerase sigma factor [Thermoleophilaceae bacterium]
MDLAVESDHLQAEELIERYGNQWLATARRSSPTAADAEDAYQRALEALLTNPPETSDPEQIAAWMHTVIRNEALQIVRSRKREVDTEFEVITGGLAADVALPEDSILDAESHGVAKEALKRLRPDQTRCLLLRADGFDYPEICRLTGFSYAKVNRLLSEGRKAARMRVDAIAAGRECERIEPLLSMFADGEADRATQNDLRMHLETCTHCRATLRDYTLAPRDLASLFPVGVLAVAGWRGRLFDPFHRVAEFVQARFGGSNTDATIAVGKKALAVFAAGATVVGGGVAIERSTEDASKNAAAEGSRGPASLITPIEVSDGASAPERRRARAARKARAATEEDLVSGDRSTSPEAANTGPITADQEVAADENDAAPQGAAEDTGTDVGGLAP